MSARQHWIDVFTLQSWNEFLTHGGTVSGFPERRWNTVKEIRPGDRLYCYVAGLYRWIGILEVTGEPFQDLTTRIWSDAQYPARVNVQVVETLAPEHAVPAVDVLGQLSFAADLKNPNKWGIYFRSSPGRLSEADAAVIDAAIRDAVANPVERPVRIPRRRESPQVIETDDGDVTIPDDDEGSEETPAVPSSDGSPHDEIQWLLLKLGSDLGLDVWVASNDRSRTWQGRAFAEVPGIRDSLPFQFDPATKRTIELIDVLWFNSNAIVAAFEVESTTSVYSGLLRMADLLAMQPYLSIPLFVVAPEDRRGKVVREVNRPTFARLPTPLADVCRLIPFEGLRQFVTDAAPYIRSMRPDVLQQISESLEASDYL